MATLINPIFKRPACESTVHRFGTLFQPIQKTRNKESDFVAFVATPIIDYVVLDAAFALDISIHFINAMASLCKAAYLWALHQQHSADLIDYETEHELKDFGYSLMHIGSESVAQMCNIFLSTLSLITRPIFSIVYAAFDLDEGGPELDRRTPAYSPSYPMAGC